MLRFSLAQLLVIVDTWLPVSTRALTCLPLMAILVTGFLPIKSDGDTPAAMCLDAATGVSSFPGSLLSGWDDFVVVGLFADKILWPDTPFLGDQACYTKGT